MADQGNSKGTVVAVSISTAKGMQKTNVPEAMLVVGHGIAGDAHAGPWHRQVSLLADESAEKIRALGVDVSAGDFAENITTSGVDLLTVQLGDQITIGEAVLEVTQIGKECHEHCAIYAQVGDCVMPREGIFTVVLKGGSVRPGDPVTLQPTPK
jgi:MOSC domain-containing protein YiiM